MIKLLKSNPPDFPDHVVVKRNGRARRMALRLDTKARAFTLTLPKGTSLKRAHKFAQEHEEWMQGKLSKLAPPIVFEHGARIPLFGQLRRINIEHDSSLKQTSIILKNKEILVRSYLDNPAPRIKRYLKKEAKARLSTLAHEKAATIGKHINEIRVRDTKTRWGSCTEDGNLNFSWRLIFAPHEALDYVVAHEVAHLVHLDHSKEFWSVCRKLSDDFVEGKYWMNEHGRELMRYG